MRRDQRDAGPARGVTSYITAAGPALRQMKYYSPPTALYEDCVYLCLNLVVKYDISYLCTYNFVIEHCIILSPNVNKNNEKQVCVRNRTRYLSPKYYR